GTETDLATYALGGYQFFAGTTWNIGRYEYHSDMWITSNFGNPQTWWVPGMKRVPADYGNWNFNRIRNSNYFFEQVLPKWKAGEITGNEDNIRHYIGEVYVNRACVYFDKLFN